MVGVGVGVAVVVGVGVVVGVVVGVGVGVAVVVGVAVGMTKRIIIGKNYRKLRPREKVERGDQYWSNIAGWSKTRNDGLPASSSGFIYRRRITTKRKAKT